MNRFALYLMAMVTGIVLAGCSDMMGNEIHVGKAEKAGPDASKVKYQQASIRIAGYVDGRNEANPRKIGKAEVRVFGLSGTDLILDRNVTDVIDDAMRRHLEDAGLQVLAKDDPHAKFELSGVIKELEYDVKARDQVHVKLDTTLKEVATGKVVWAGEVDQKSDRFAGVSGDTRSDIADYLKQQIGIVVTKTTSAVDGVLQASYPELFNLTPGSKVIPGVEVFVTPGVVTQEPNNSAVLKPLGGANGQLVVRTEPAGAKVYLDGVYYGTSPLTIQFAAGIRTVEVKLKGYRNASDKVAVRPGQTTEWEMQLEK